MRKLLANLFARLLKGRRSRRPAAAPPAPGTFAALAADEQRIAVQYLIASAKMQSCLDGILIRKRAVDHQEALSAYDQAETAYVSAGFAPFLPSSLRGRLASTEPDAIQRSGLVRKADESERLVFVTRYAPGIRSRITQLLARGDVSFLDTAAAERRFQEIIAEGRPPAPAPAKRTTPTGPRRGHLRLV
jgi:hypothetical protein